MTIDLGASLRRIKIDKHCTRLKRRAREAVVAADDIAEAGRGALLLDTNVYIHAAAGTLPSAAAESVGRGLLFH